MKPVTLTFMVPDNFNTEEYQRHITSMSPLQMFCAGMCAEDHYNMVMILHKVGHKLDSESQACMIAGIVRLLDEITRMKVEEEE